MLGDLGQVQVLGGEELEDSQARFVTERPMEADHRLGRGQPSSGLEGVIGHRIGEEPPVRPGQQDVVGPAEVRRRQDDPADADLGQPADATGRALDELGRLVRPALGGAQRVLSRKGQNRKEGLR